MADMVRFGLSNVHYAVYNGSAYDTPKAIEGAVQLTTSPEGDSNTFYADNRAYFTTETNAGYTGTLEVAAVNDDFLSDVLGYEDDATSGLTYESTDAVQTSVALMFEVSGNVEKQRGCFYNVTFSRLEKEHNTTSESTEPDTVTLNFTAIGRNFTVDGETKNIVFAQCDDGDEAAYGSFFTEVVCPGTAPTGATGATGASYAKVGQAAVGEAVVG